MIPTKSSQIKRDSGARSNAQCSVQSQSHQSLSVSQTSSQLSEPPLVFQIDLQQIRANSPRMRSRSPQMSMASLPKVKDNCSSHVSCQTSIDELAPNNNNNNNNRAVMQDAISNSISKSRNSNITTEEDKKIASSSSITIIIPIEISNAPYPVQCAVNPKQNINGIMMGLVKNHQELASANQKLVKQYILTRINHETQQASERAHREQEQYRMKKLMAQEQQEEQKQMESILSEEDVLACKRIFDRMDVFKQDKINYASYKQLCRRKLPEDRTLLQTCLKLLHRREMIAFPDFLLFVLTEPDEMDALIRNSSQIS